ncbi:MAG: multiheme c-type cytochrome [Planctomycetota bacterium]
MKASRVTFGFLTMCLLISTGCSGDSSSSSLSIFFSGDTSGWITPCGCTSNQSGGLSRRDTLISKHRQSSEVLLFDVGGNVAGDSQYDLSKLKYIFNGLRLMDYDVVNLGGPESQFSADQLRAVFTEDDLPLLSTNVTDQQGKPIGKTHVVLHACGKSVAVLGVVDPDLVGNELIASDPGSAILRELDLIDSDLVVLLAYMDAPKLREFANRFPELDAVMGGPTGQVVPPTLVGSAMVASATNKGKFLVHWQLPSGAEDRSAVENTRIVEVESSIEMASRQQQNLDSFYAALDESDFSPNQTTFVSARVQRKGGNLIAGSETCVPCHQSDDAVWHNSKHVHAWASLEMTGAQVDPACQRCHTTGYGRQGGFVSHRISSQRVNVGCENCHGPSSRHVENPRTKTPYDARGQCLQCHDHENSPTFEYEEFWNRIIHGKTLSQARTPVTIGLNR